MVNIWPGLVSVPVSVPGARGDGAVSRHRKGNSMIVSMTGFAAARGQGQGYVWSWDLRSVNGRGLDLRLRVPDWIEGLEQALRAELGRAIGRGNVSLSLRLQRETEGGADQVLRLNITMLTEALAAMRQIEHCANEVGVALAHSTSAEVLALRGVVETTQADPDTPALRDRVLADLPGLLADFTAMRRAEGKALAAVIAGQLDRIETLTLTAAGLADARRARGAGALREALARVLDSSDGVDPQRLAQELALIAVKQDIAEEIDRLKAHVGAGRALLADGGAVGRKFDFLVQEFMREANTLCSKAQDLELTRVGLDLKTVIDQLREQIQNVE